MKFLNKIKEYKTSHMRESVILSKNWFVFRWEIITIITLALFAALLNQIPNWYVVKFNGNIDPIHSYPLRDNIAYSSFSIFTTIGIAIFIGVFTEMGKFAGKYGSAIFILVPSFVWLLSDRPDDHIVDILTTAKFLGTIIFWAIFAIFILFAILTIIKQIIVSASGAYRSRLRIEFIYNYVNRFSIVILNILIVLMLGYAFINYGIFSLHLADITKKTATPKHAVGTYDLHSEKFTVYIALIAVGFALLMVIIGLTSIFSKNEQKNDYEVETTLYTSEANMSYAEQEDIKNTLDNNIDKGGD